MAYYGMGDYYTGDYYQGDPFALPLVAGLGGAIAKKVLPGLARRVFGRVAAIAPRVLGGRTTIAAGAGAAAFSALRPPVAPPGYVLKPGFKGKIQRLLPGGETGFIKRRRMNVTNPKALRRAIRRAQGFAKLARRVLTFTSPRAPRGKPYFKRARR